MADEMIATNEKGTRLSVAIDNLLVKYRNDVNNNEMVDAAHEVGLRTAAWVMERASFDYSTTSGDKERMYYLRMVLDAAKLMTQAGSSLRSMKYDMGAGETAGPAGRGNVIEGEEGLDRPAVEDRMRATLAGRKNVLDMGSRLRTEAKKAFGEVPEECRPAKGKPGWPKGKKRGPRVNLDRAGEG